MTTRARSRGRSGRSSVGQGTGSVITLAMTAVGPPSNGVRPVSSSKRMTPRAHTSLRASAAAASRSCSGAQYAGVPKYAFDAVMRASPSPSIFEIPKSSTLTTSRSPTVQRKRFAGLRSRCTIPSPWASCIAPAVCSTRSTARATGIAPVLPISASRSRPSRYSMTM
jgi:hypothetical protein